MLTQKRTPHREYIETYRNVTIDTRSRRRQLFASDGSDGDDRFVSIWRTSSSSSHTSLATSMAEAVIAFDSVANGFRLFHRGTRIEIGIWIGGRPNTYLNITSMQSVVLSSPASTSWKLSESELMSDLIENESLASSGAVDDVGPLFSAESMDVMKFEKPFFIVSRLVPKSATEPPRVDRECVRE